MIKAGPEKANAPVTALVNSSDGFADCWDPFFSLFRKYWPECRFPILLNTEQKVWKYEGLDLRCSQVSLGETNRLSWSECLIRAIDQVETPLLLYFQEDYFIDKPVRAEAVKRAVDLMLERPEIGHIALTKQGSHAPFLPYNVKGYSVIGQKSRYRISTQAGLWRCDVLKSYLDPKENGWMFEIFGTWRAHGRKDIFLVADFDSSVGGAAIDYVHTGIIKGRWHPAMPDIFQQNGIDMDFALRGFYIPANPILHKWEVVKKLLQDPLHAARQLF
jgi:hypothetical protein